MASQFIMPNQVVMGENALIVGGNALKSFGQKALIVTDSVMVQLGNLKVVEESLKNQGIEYVIYPEINGEPTDMMVEKGLAIYKDENCDFLIALGGGSPIDSMKAIGALVTNGGNISDYLGKIIEKKTPAMVAIPTTAGTGSEATQFTIIADTKKNIKMLLKGEVLMPNLAIVDPQFTMTAPPKVTAATGLDALTHAIEAYTSKKAQYLSDIFAISAVKRIFKYLPLAFKEGNNVEAREQMSLAALEAGITFNNASVTVVHGMSRPIGALFHVPHGISNAMLLKECFKFVLDGAYERFAILGREINVASSSMSDEEASKAFLEAVIEICKVLRIPTLEEYGINREEFFAKIDKMSTDALESGSPGNTRKTLTKSDIEQIYRNLWN